MSELDLNPLSPWCGEPKGYTLSSPGLAPLELHPSRVVRFLGNPLPDPSVAGALWSDSVLQALYDAVHAAALSLAGATSLLHEAKVDIVTVPNLSEHLSSAETTEQLSARFAYAAAMKSMNNLLLLGDGESWSRQSVDFAGLPEMARTFLQVAAGAADIPVTRLLGQSPAGLSATGESDVRNYYDMIAARQELDLRPQLERLDRLICWSEGIDPGALTFAFRPLWQLDEPAKAALALSRAQATQVYAGLGLWRAEVTAKLVEAQLIADGTYPNAAAVFAEQAEVVNDAREVGAVPRASGGFLPEGDEPRDWHGRWTTGAESGTGALVGSALRTASPAQGQQLAGPLPVPNTPADPSGAAGQGPHAPDGTPVELASSKNRARALTRMMGALAAAARFVWRWLPEAGDEPELPPAPDVSPQPPPPSPAPPQVQPSPLSLQDLTRVTRGFAGRKSAQKWLNQMNSREWTPEQIEEAIQSGERFHESQRIDPTHGATRYVHPRTGRSVTIDDITGQIIQFGGDGFDY